MGNSMGRDLTGCVVLIAARFLRPEYADEEQRKFRVEGGFGAMPHTAGNAMFGVWLHDGTRDRTEGYMVERVLEEPPPAAGCRRCGKPITNTRGQWWGADDDFMCPDGEEQHAPESAAE